MIRIVMLEKKKSLLFASKEINFRKNFLIDFYGNPNVVVGVSSIVRMFC